MRVRPPRPVLRWLEVIAPLILIVAMSWAVFWIDPKDTSTKISITITAMLTLIAYRLAIGANLSAISHMTRRELGSDRILIRVCHGRGRGPAAGLEK